MGSRLLDIINEYWRQRAEVSISGSADEPATKHGPGAADDCAIVVDNSLDFQQFLYWLRADQSQDYENH